MMFKEEGSIQQEQLPFSYISQDFALHMSISYVLDHINCISDSL